MKVDALTGCGVVVLACCLTARTATAAGNVDVCHLEGNGSYHLISVSENAKAAHIRHGDGLPGGPIPGSGSFIGAGTMTTTAFGQVNLEFEGAGATFAPDCNSGQAAGSFEWDRVTGEVNSWAGPMVSISFAGDGQTVDFTVRVDSAAGRNLVGCDISLRVTEGPANVGMWAVIAVVDSPGGVCVAVGEIQGPWTIDSGDIIVEGPMF